MNEQQITIGVLRRTLDTSFPWKNYKEISDEDGNEGIEIDGLELWACAHNSLAYNVSGIPRDLSFFTVYSLITDLCTEPKAA